MPEQGLRVPKAVAETMVAHCQKEYPKEACGFLATNAAGTIEQVYPMTNTEHSPIAYQMDPKEQLQVMRHMRQANHQIAAIYHSHTASAAYPSPVDVQLAVYPEVSYVLVSLANQTQPDIKSYRIEAGVIRPEPLVVEG